MCFGISLPVNSILTAWHLPLNIDVLMCVGQMHVTCICSEECRGKRFSAAAMMNVHHVRQKLGTMIPHKGTRTCTPSARILFSSKCSLVRGCVVKPWREKMIVDGECSSLDLKYMRARIILILCIQWCHAWLCRYTYVYIEMWCPLTMGNTALLTAPPPHHSQHQPFAEAESSRLAARVVDLLPDGAMFGWDWIWMNECVIEIYYCVLKSENPRPSV